MLLLMFNLMVLRAAFIDSVHKSIGRKEVGLAGQLNMWEIP